MAQKPAAAAASTASTAAGAGAAVPEETKAKTRKVELDNLLLSKFFFVPSFEIYGGVGGLYDYGPPGCAVMANLQQFWRKHFVLAESMLEISCPGTV